MSDLRKNLTEKVRNSIVLKQKLTEEQIEKFLKKVLELPEDGQEALIEKFTEEEAFFEEQKKKQIEIINQYTAELDNELKNFNKDVRAELEREECEKDGEIEGELLEELKQI